MAVGQNRTVATIENGWLDILGVREARPSGATIPVVAQVGATGIWLPQWAIGDIDFYRFHIPHGIDPTAGCYLHMHYFTEGTQTNFVKWQFRYAYAHGYGRGRFNLASLTTVSIEQQVELFGGGSETHMIAEIASPILAGSAEIDGMLLVEVSRIAAAGAATTNPVFGLGADIHAKADRLTTLNKNYPFYT
jgi:hypothetical protein